MRLLKIGFILCIIAGLYSFSQEDKYSYLDSYEEFIAKFRKVKCPAKLAFVGYFHFTRKVNGAKRIRTTSPASVVYYNMPEKSVWEITRMGRHHHREEVLLASTDQYDLVVYSEDEFEDKRRTYRIASFDKKGKAIGMSYMGVSDRNNYLLFELLAPNRFHLKCIERKRDYDTKDAYKPFAVEKEYFITVGKAGEINYESISADNED